MKVVVEVVATRAHICNPSAPLKNLALLRYQGKGASTCRYMSARCLTIDLKRCCFRQKVAHAQASTGFGRGGLGPPHRLTLLAVPADLTARVADVRV